jgi:CRP-like cAMP-binding protein
MAILTGLNDLVTALPRGGYLVNTSAGYIQFGAPPETIKDTMMLPLGVPRIFVLPYELFNWLKGMSIAELEFPIYYNYFIRKMKTRIVCFEDQVEIFTRLLGESIFGPQNTDFRDDFAADMDLADDIKNEMINFRIIELPDVVEFLTFKKGACKIEDITIRIDPNRNFDILDRDELAAHVPGMIVYKPKYIVGERLSDPYTPPLYGMTCLGPSSGYDPEENTSGFILWLNHHGVMIDPPVNSTEWLLDSNVSPKYIDSIILTHCHADHDAGTFQKILEEGRITIYTTKTIIESFIRKYSALTGVSGEYLMSLFEFRQVKIGSPLFIHGGRFDVFYSLHSIPAIGFKVDFQGKSLVYSSDHNGDPVLHRELYDKGIISKKRYDGLSSFPWDSTLIYHEAGIPPLHTPIKYLNSLPEDIQKKIIIYHFPKKEIPADTFLRPARFGIENTILFDVEHPAFEQTYRILSLIRNIDFFREMTITKAQEFVSIVNEERFNKGEYIIKKGSAGDKFYIIYSGNVSIHSDDERYQKVYGPYDYFGEAALISGEKRSADVKAETSAILYSIEKDRFINFMDGTDYLHSLNRLSSIRDEEAWDILSTSRFLKSFTPSQRLLIESILKPVDIPADTPLYKEGEIISHVYIIREGRVIVELRDMKIAVLQKGDIIGSTIEIYNSRPSSYSFFHSEPLKVYCIEQKEFVRFLDGNPGLIMKLDYIFRQYLFLRT